MRTCGPRPGWSATFRRAPGCRMSFLTTKPQVDARVTGLPHITSRPRKSRRRLLRTSSHARPGIAIGIGRSGGQGGAGRRLLMAKVSSVARFSMLRETSPRKAVDRPTELMQGRACSNACDACRWAARRHRPHGGIRHGRPSAALISRHSTAPSRKEADRPPRRAGFPWGSGDSLRGGVC